MLGECKVFATIPVSDIDNAKYFYRSTLGLKKVHQDTTGATFESGGGCILLYPSPEAGASHGIHATWYVDDIASVAAELKAKGVLFENYDLPGATREGDIYVMGAIKTAWFKDPDGNILAICDRRQVPRNE